MNIYKTMMILSFETEGKKRTITAKMGDDLLLALDKFLKSNKIKPNTIKSPKLSFKGDLLLTSKQIGEIITKVLNWSSSGKF